MAKSGCAFKGLLYFVNQSGLLVTWQWYWICLFGQLLSGTFTVSSSSPNMAPISVSHVWICFILHSNCKKQRVALKTTYNGIVLEHPSISDRWAGFNKERVQLQRHNLRCNLSHNLAKWPVWSCSALVFKCTNQPGYQQQKYLNKVCAPILPKFCTLNKSIGYNLHPSCTYLLTLQLQVLR